MSDATIIETARVLGWLAFVAGGLALVVLCLVLTFSIIRRIWGMKLLMEAMTMHREKHPEKWERYAKTTIP